MVFNKVYLCAFVTLSLVSQAGYSYTDHANEVVSGDANNTESFAKAGDCFFDDRLNLFRQVTDSKSGKMPAVAPETPGCPKKSPEKTEEARRNFKKQNTLKLAWDIGPDSQATESTQKCEYRYQECLNGLAAVPKFDPAHPQSYDSASQYRRQGEQLCFSAYEHCAK